MRGVRSRTAILAVLAPFALTAPASAEPAVGVLTGAGNLLVTFDTSSPGAITGARAITGLQPDEQIAGLDFRYATIGATAPGLFALGVVDGAGTDDLRLYRLDPATGVATLLSAAPITSPTDGTAYGVDFNPTVDRLRVVNDADESLRIDPNTGLLAGFDTDLNPAGFNVGAVAYDRVNLVGAGPTGTTLHALAGTPNWLATIGGIDQTPSPNLGLVQNLKPLGVAIVPGETLNLDIAVGGTAFATAVSVAGGVPGLYTANLSTGALSLIGVMPAALRAFALVPASTVSFTAAPVTQPETGVATLTVTRSGDTTGSATVDYATVGGSVSTADFTFAAGTLTFAAGEVSKTLSVAITADTVDEPDESFSVTLSAPGAPLALGTPASVTVTITDDDATPAPRDTVAPRVAFASAPRTIGISRLRTTGLVLKVRPSEAASLVVVLEVSARRLLLANGFNLTLVSKSFGRSAAQRTVKLKPAKALVGLPTRRFTVRIRIVATDAAGNRRTVTRNVTVTPVPRR